MDLDFLDGNDPVDTNTPAPQHEEGSASAGQPRDEQGRFANPQPAPASDAPPVNVDPANADAAPQAPVPPAPPPGYVPEAVVAELRQKLRDREQAAPPAPPQPPPAQPEIPDPYEDPEGYHAYQQREVQSQVKAATLNMSRMMAEQQHGPEAVSQALAWAAERANIDPTFRSATWNSPHPVQTAIDAFRQHQVMSDVGNDPDAYVRRRALELGFVAAPAPPAPGAQPSGGPTPPPAPPRSLAAAPAAGGGKPGDVPTGPGAAFDATFN